MRVVLIDYCHTSCSVGLFTPDMAFEAIVKKQISRLKEPTQKCVDLVVTELSSVVRQCAETVNRYPRLRDIIESTVTGFMRQQEANAKIYMNTIVDAELAYMNTHHEDFNPTEAKSSSSTAKKNLGNQVIRKGWLSVHNISFVRGSRDCWFVLTSDTLSWFKDDEVRCLAFSIAALHSHVFRKRRKNTCCNWTVSSCAILRRASCRDSTNLHSFILMESEYTLSRAKYLDSFTSFALSLLTY